MGVYIAGLFVCSAEYLNQDGTVTHAITIATDKDAYRVFMDQKTDAKIISDLQIGVPVRVRCRPYVKKNGALAWGGGTDLRVGE